MIPSYILKNLLNDDKNLTNLKKSLFNPLFIYNPKNYYLKLTKSAYFNALIVLRHYIKFISDYYFGIKQKAKNIDLFMITSSVSSPSGPGSDSEPIKIRFGKLETFLTDSSQFGFEPLLLNNLRKVYCYLPSMRGENPDSRHLNQFFHCEFEMIGDLDKLIIIVENYIKTLCGGVLLMSNIINKISESPNQTREALKNIIKAKKFPEITFDEAVKILLKNNKKKYINFSSHGRNISANGEIELMKILKLKTPVWIKYFDRDRVPFYQKPDPKNNNKTINADLIFPSLIKNSFSGEIVGSGQRQDNHSEIYESLKRQKISPNSYEWYINLRKIPNYRTTSGFGFGVERFIAWVLAKKDIKDVILYPRLKNIRSYP